MQWIHQQILNQIWNSHKSNQFEMQVKVNQTLANADPSHEKLAGEIILKACSFLRYLSSEHV